MLHSRPLNHLLATLVFCTGLATASRGQTMFIENCSLGCSSGSSGPVSCGTFVSPADAEIVIRFSRPVELSTVNPNSFSLVDVATGIVPSGFVFLDPHDPQRLVFRPSTVPSPAGGFTYGLVPGSTYLVRVAGQAQGDLPPYVSSADLIPLANQNRMQCAILIDPPAFQGLTPYCFGTSAACPCGNAGAPDRGCANSIVPQGARFEAQGSTRISLDTVVLFAHGMPESTCLFFQGTTRTNGGAGAPFGDGLRCASGTVIRLATYAISPGGLTAYPGGGDPSTSIRGGVTLPGSRTYQVWYRNAASFCTPSTFNLSNGVEITWQA